MEKKIGRHRLRVSSSEANLAEEAAALFVDLAAREVSAKGAFTVALSGGSTPVPVYRALASPEMSSRVHWKMVYLFWGDERCVSPDDPESNYHGAFEHLVSKVDIPETNVHPIRGELDPAEAAREYENNVRGFFSASGLPFSGLDPWAPIFDLIFLGLGADGHTLSLFPDTTALFEGRRLVVENFVEKLASWRVTMTTRLVNRARNVVFLVSGEDKAEALARVVGPEGDETPAGKVKPDGGTLWLVDRAAASRL